MNGFVLLFVIMFKIQIIIMFKIFILFVNFVCYFLLCLKFLIFYFLLCLKVCFLLNYQRFVNVVCN